MNRKNIYYLDSPVKDFPMQYSWQHNIWEKIFDKQVEIIRQDIQRAKANSKLVIYLSCPISSRGGGNHATNIDIAKYKEQELLAKWGENFWILNPVRYQLESKEGTGLINNHIKSLGLSESDVNKLLKPQGGDYMRMWTKVLVEDGKNNSGQYFDGFYFIGPKDVHQFFMSNGSMTLTAAIESYFSRKYIVDQDFRKNYEVDSVKVINQFFRFYALRASTAFSLGSHDEWNIFFHINQKRLKLTVDNENINGDVGELLAGYFDGEQVPLDISLASSGYEIPRG